MKICIVTYDEYINIPYVQKYEELLKKHNIEYDIILWNRSEESTEVFDRDNSVYIFRSKTKKSKLSKVVPFVKWRKFVLGIIRKNKYDRLIILTTIPAVLISRCLINRYVKRFVFDIRDYTYENNKMYKMIVNKLIRASYITTISSQGFYKWLNRYDNILINHNISNSEMNEKECGDISKKANLTIGFVGGIRYMEENIAIINQLKNNKCLNMLYVGKVHPGNDIQLYCQENNITNVYFKPRYVNKDKPKIYKEIDIINSLYGAKSLEVTTALPNKLYDCVIFKKPIMVSSNTYLEEVVKKYKLGFSIDINKDDITSEINKYLSTFDKKEFIKGCNEFLNNVLLEEKLFFKRIEPFFLDSN